MKRRRSDATSPEPSREALVAQIEALRRLVERERAYIDSMRSSRLWQLRDELVALRARLTGTPDPLPIAGATERAKELAALGDPYQLVLLRGRRSAEDVILLRRLVSQLAMRERIDVIVDARHAKVAALEDSLSSLRDQIYPHWRARVWFEPFGTAEQAWLRGAFLSDDRVTAEPWSGSSVDPEGAVAVLEAGDLLEADALLLVAVELFEGADVVYTDEDRLRDDGLCDAPRFKPDWSPETLWTRDYVGRLCAFRGSKLVAAGGIDEETGSARWYDALLRASAMSDRIAHVPRVLYHRRNPSRPLATAETERVLVRELSRRGECARVRILEDAVVPEFLARDDERVAVIIPTRDRAELLDRCLRSLFDRTTHPAFEVIIVDNDSAESATRKLLDRWKTDAPERFRVLKGPGQFNFSRLNNRAVRETDAPFLVFLNNDTEVITPDWMTAMLGQARRRPVGAVGALLLYEDETIQHAGIVLGGVLGQTGHAYRNVRPYDPPAPAALQYDTNYLAVTGACLMVGHEKFDQVGGLDETLAVAFNDVDFCLKLHQVGYRNVLVPRAQLYHHESRSRGTDDTRAKRGRAFAEGEILRKRWPQWVRRDPYYNPNLTVSAEDFSVRL